MGFFFFFLSFFFSNLGGGSVGELVVIIHKEGQPNLATGQRENYKNSGFLLIFGNMLELVVYIWLFPHKNKIKNPQNVMTL
jgi:hypothetical protein